MTPCATLSAQRRGQAITRRVIDSTRLRSCRRATDSVVRSKRSARRISVNIASTPAPPGARWPPAIARPSRRRSTHVAVSSASGESRSSRSAERACVCQRSDRGSARCRPTATQVEAVEQLPVDGATERDRAPWRRPVRRGRSRCAAAATRRPLGERSGTPAASRSPRRVHDVGHPAASTGSSPAIASSRDARAELRHRRRDVDRRAAVTQQPQRRPLDHPPAVEEQVELRVERPRPGRGRRSPPTATAKSKTSRRRATPGSRRP